jgi:hypothetical protein
MAYFAPASTAFIAFCFEQSLVYPSLLSLTRFTHYPGAVAVVSIMSGYVLLWGCGDLRPQGQCSALALDGKRERDQGWETGNSTKKLGWEGEGD